MKLHDIRFCLNLILGVELSLCMAKDRKQTHCEQTQLLEPLGLVQGAYVQVVGVREHLVQSRILSNSKPSAILPQVRSPVI